MGRGINYVFSNLQIGTVHSAVTVFAIPWVFPHLSPTMHGISRRVNLEGIWQMQA